HRPARLARLPGALHTAPTTAARKRIFIKTLRPIVEAELERIAEQRRWLLARREAFRSGRLFARERPVLAPLAQEYPLPAALQPPAAGPIPEATVAALLERVDVVPASLVIAQAAIESGWGRSRFARLGNNLFGQWVTGDTPGIEPLGAAGAGFRLAAYPTPAASVRSYLRNLNTHPAYRRLRRLRARLRAEGRPLDGITLAAGLRLYSERRDAYVAELRRIIRDNHLETAGRVTLASAGLDPVP
ncbi:MAG: hypothetical protein D6739_09910, partial [Nitrospirae bacterium]